MKVIAINGVSKSGKTTVCQTMISGLRRLGYSVGSVKEIHFEGFAIDQEPLSNTFRHRQAGSQLVTARGLNETDILYPGKLPIVDILSHYDQDFVILEGVSDCCCPRILTAHDSSELEERWDERVAAVSGVFANEHQGHYRGQPVINALSQPERLVELVQRVAFSPLPHLDPKCCSACGYSCMEMAGRIVQGQARPEDCRLSLSRTELRVDGRPLTLAPFVQNILANAVLAIASELDGYQPGAAIEVSLGSKKSE